MIWAIITYSYGSVVIGVVQGVVYSRVNKIKFLKYIFPCIFYCFISINSLLWFSFFFSKHIFICLDYAMICNSIAISMICILIVTLESFLFKKILGFRYHILIAFLFWTATLLPLTIFQHKGISFIYGSNKFSGVTLPNDIQKYTRLKDGNVDIISNPHGGIFYIDNSMNIFREINIQSLFYRWTPAEFIYMKNDNIIFIYNKNGSFIYDISRSILSCGANITAVR